MEFFALLTTVLGIVAIAIANGAKRKAATTEDEVQHLRIALENLGKRVAELRKMAAPASAPSPVGEQAPPPVEPVVEPPVEPIVPLAATGEAPVPPPEPEPPVVETPVIVAPPPPPPPPPKPPRPTPVAQPAAAFDWESF